MTSCSSRWAIHSHERETRQKQRRHSLLQPTLREQQPCPTISHGPHSATAGAFPGSERGNDTQLVPLLQEAMQELGDEESSLRVRVLARLAGALRDEPSLEPRSSLSRQAVEIARRLGKPPTRLPTRS